LDALLHPDVLREKPLACPLREHPLWGAPGYFEAYGTAPLRSGTDQIFIGLIMYFSTRAPNGLASRSIPAKYPKGEGDTCRSDWQDLKIMVARNLANRAVQLHADYEASPKRSEGEGGQV
jgi:hypothetical protein